MAQTLILNRREFLKSSSVAGAGLLIGFHLDARAATDPAESQEKPVVNPFNAWVRITPDNRITLILANSEMGQCVAAAVMNISRAAAPALRNGNQELATLPLPPVPS